MLVDCVDALSMAFHLYFQNTCPEVCLIISRYLKERAIKLRYSYEKITRVLNIDIITCTMYTVHLQCTFNDIHCTLYNVHYTPYIVHSTRIEYQLGLIIFICCVRFIYCSLLLYIYTPSNSINIL